MAKLQESSKREQKELLVVPIIDTSESMSGESITAVNKAMSELPAQLADIEKSEDFDVLVAPIAFSNGAKWLGLLNGKPCKASDFVWNDVEATGGADMGSAFSLLNEKLTIIDKGGWIDGRKGLRPIILLISNGKPTDEWLTPLNELRKRGWFKAALKFAFAVGADADKTALEEFTQTEENIYDIEILNHWLIALIRYILGISPVSTADVEKNKAYQTDMFGDMNMFDETMDFD